MKRKFITNLALLLFLNLLVKPFWIFGIDRTVQNTVGSEQYGLYFSLFSFSLLLNIILDMGITNFNNRSIARDETILPSYFSQIVPLKFILAVFYGIVCIAAGKIIGYSGEQMNLLYILIFNNFLLSFILYLRSNLSGLQLFLTDSFLSVLDRFLLICFCSILLWGKLTDNSFTIKMFIYAQAASYIITALVALIIVISRSGKIKLQIHISNGSDILKKSFPFALLIMLMSFFNRIDSVMIERLLVDGKLQAGVYAQSFRILDAVSMFAFLVAGLLLPMFSRMIKQNKPVVQLLKLSISLLMIPGIILVTISCLYGNEIMTALYNEHTDISTRIYSFLIFSCLPVSVTYIFGTLLTSNGNLRQLNILAGITVFLNIGLNLVLIPRYMAEGAAYSNLASQSFFALSQVFLAKKLFHFKTDYLTLLKFSGFIMIVSIAGIIFERSGIPWIKGLLYLTILGIISSWIFNIITPKKLYSIIKTGE